MSVNPYLGFDLKTDEKDVEYKGLIWTEEEFILNNNLIGPQVQCLLM